MRILLVSPVWESSLGFFCERAFQKMNHQVVSFDYRLHALGYSEPRNRKAGPLEIVRNRLGIMLMNWRLRRTVAQLSPDLVLVIKGELIEPTTVKALAEAGKGAIVLWYPDTSLRLTDRGWRRIVKGMRWYHISFVCDPDHLPPDIKPQIRRMEELTFACDPDFHRPVAVTPSERAEFGSKICFAGNWQGASSPRYHWLKQLSDYPVTVWGHGWDASDLAERGLDVRGRAVYGVELLKVYSSTSIALNFCFFPLYLNLRTFEVPACGPLMVTDALPQLERYFRPDEEVVTFATAEELRTKLDFYLQHPEAAKRIAQKGQERAHREHTFERRMMEIIQKVKS